MNCASPVFVGGLAISAAWYFVWGKSNYRGPNMEEAGAVPGSLGPGEQEVGSYAG